MEAIFKSKIPNCRIQKKVERNDNEIDIIINDQNNVQMMVKIIDVEEIKEKNVLKFLQKNSLHHDWQSFTYPLQTQIIGYNMMILERRYYMHDLEEIIKSEWFISGDICSMICDICDILMILNGYDIMMVNVKSSNIIIENGRIKLCDLLVDNLRKDEDMSIYDVCFKSPEEVNGYECNERSVIWSIGCILYEMITKKLPFSEDDNINKTKDNILRCNYSLNMECDDMMKEMINKMLKVKGEDRLSLKELRKEMMKMNEILRDDDYYLMMCNERKDILFRDDEITIFSPIKYPAEYYCECEKWEEIRDDLVESYNNKANERILSILLMMKLYKGDKSIKDRISFKILHRCKNNEECYLDEMICNIECYDKEKEILLIESKCICLCEEGVKYFFNILKLVNPTTVEFGVIRIPIKYQTLFGSYFNEMLNIKELKLYGCTLTCAFIESFVKSINYMKLRYVDLSYTRIGTKGFKLLVPYLYLCINTFNELNLCGMNLNDDSIILLSQELTKYPNIERIAIRDNNNIHENRFRALFSKYPYTNIIFDANNYPNFSDSNIDDDSRNDNRWIDFSNMKISKELMLKIDSLKNIRIIMELDISNNEITSDEIDLLVKYMTQTQKIKHLYIHNNPIGNNGLKSILNNLNLTSLIKMNEINLNNTSVDDESVILLANKLSNLNCCERISLKGNNIRMTGLKSICAKSLRNDTFPFIAMKCEIWENDELEYYLDYCVKKKTKYNFYDFSNLNVKDSHISLIKQIDYSDLDLCNNKITEKGLKELADSLPKKLRYISIFGNKIGDEGLETIYKCFDKFVDYELRLDVSNIGMSGKGLKMLIERLEDYGALVELNLEGNELNEGELSLMEKSQEVFDNLDELSITVKNDIDKFELKMFLETFSSIGIIKIDGISEEKKKELCKEIFNIK